MNISRHYQLLLFLCILSIYYNFFLSVFRFDFIKIKSIEIGKQIKYVSGTNMTIDSIPTFMASLKNKPDCIIDSRNEIQISNIKKNMKSKKKYYVVVTNDKKNICSKVFDTYEIIITYITFYISMLILSTITVSVIIEYFLIFNTGEYLDELMTSKCEQITINEYWVGMVPDEIVFEEKTSGLMMSGKKISNDEDKISHDYIYV